MLLADRGYDADWIRELAMKKGAGANIPPKSNRNNPICLIKSGNDERVLRSGSVVNCEERKRRSNL
jgi:hypothetical protein